MRAGVVRGEADVLEAMRRPRKEKLKAPPICPVCGEDVPRGALACPDCGADHNSGWREDAEMYDGVDLPEEFDYEEFARNEFGSSLKPARISTVWWATAILLVVITFLYFYANR